jgi:site-specific recombinase XerD
MYGKDDVAIRIPVMKKSHTLPEVLSKSECKELFKAPKSFKHRFLLAFAYSTGMRLSELRFVKISDIDTDRMQVRIRQGKGKKDRYVMLSLYIKTKLPVYLETCKPEKYLFEGNTQGHEMCERSIQNVIIIYLHIAQVLPKSAKSPLDTLYNF